MRVVMLAPEVHPYAKTGGLADVLAALPPALTRIGVEASVCLPAVVPAFLGATADLYPELAAVRAVQTVHNLAFQGRFPSEEWHLLNLDPRHFVPDGLEFFGDINYLKAGLLFADAITTVSPRYAEEIQTPSFGSGLDGVLRMRADRLRGIPNGVDDAVWNPASDPFVPAHYDQGDLRGKARCKAALQADLGLAVSPEPALLAVVSR